MAERRMFAKTIVTSDAFLDMPLSARCLYFTLGMLADDDGFVNSPKSIMRQVGASVDDLNLLLAKKFVLAFESGVIVIKHWRINNYLQKDRYVETKYVDEKKKLFLDKNGSYVLDNNQTMYTECIQDVYGMYTQDRLGKDSIGYKERNISKKESFTPPTVEQVLAYCSERHNNVDAERFVDFYSAKGWMVGKNRMKDWKAAVRTWERSEHLKKEEQHGQAEDDDYNIYNVRR